MRSREGFVGILVLGGILAWTGGCVGGASAPARFYTLAPVERPAGGSARAPEGGMALGVGPVAIPAYLDRAQIVTRTSPEKIVLAEYDRWSEPLKESLPRVLGENLGALLATDRVVRFPWPTSAGVRHRVIVDVTRFEGTAADRSGEQGNGGAAAEVTLEARWRILAGEGKPVAAGRTAVREAAAAPGYDALVAAMSRALGRLSREIAAALPAVPG